MNVKTALLVLAEGFEEVEALGTADVLRRLKIRVLLAGLGGLSIRGSHHITVTADVEFASAPFATSSAIILPGGMPGALHLRDDPELPERLREFDRAGKILAAICAAPAVLKAAGVAEGRRITGYPGCESLAGTEPFSFSGNLVEHDGNIITGKGPGAVFAFAAEIARAFQTPEEEIRSVLDGMFIR